MSELPGESAVHVPELGRTFGRLRQFDERSRGFAIADKLAPRARPRSFTWRCVPHFDQGAEGACVGFGWTHEAAARPAVVAGLTAADAFALYRRARQLDEFPGEDYEGTSVLAGAKAQAEAGRLREYRWAFSLDELILAVGYHGPAVIGVDWFEGMAEPDRYGRIKAAGPVLGGHCTLIKGVSVPRREFLIHQSWGVGHGLGGDVRLSWDDTALLISRRADLCIPVVR